MMLPLYFLLGTDEVNATPTLLQRSGNIPLRATVHAHELALTMYLPFNIQTILVHVHMTS